MNTNRQKAHSRRPNVRPVVEAPVTVQPKVEVTAPAPKKPSLLRRYMKTVGSAVKWVAMAPVRLGSACWYSIIVPTMDGAAKYTKQEYRNVKRTLNKVLDATCARVRAEVRYINVLVSVLVDTVVGAVTVAYRLSAFIAHGVIAMFCGAIDNWRIAVLARSLDRNIRRYSRLAFLVSARVAVRVASALGAFAFWALLGMAIGTMIYWVVSVVVMKYAIVGMLMLAAANQIARGGKYIGRSVQAIAA